MCDGLCLSVCVEVKGQLSRVSSLLAPCGSGFQEKCLYLQNHLSSLKQIWWGHASLLGHHFHGLLDNLRSPPSFWAMQKFNWDMLIQDGLFSSRLLLLVNSHFQSLCFCLCLSVCLPVCLFFSHTHIFSALILSALPLPLDHFIFWDWVSESLGWPWTHYIANNGLDLLMLVILLPQGWLLQVCASTLR